MTIPIVIPAFEPDSRLLELLAGIDANGMGPVVLVDDGSGSSYADLFGKAAKIVTPKHGIVLSHSQNHGKGAALKTAFSYVLDNIPDAIGVVTADSDGQHSVDCIESVVGALRKHDEALVLGVRSFDGKDVPWKSRFGNNVTRVVMRAAAGVNVSDTQTGLRGIPRDFMGELVGVRGEGYEFETNMLLELNGREIVEVPILTIYDSRDAHKTHFDPIRDSWRIYRVLLGRFFRFTGASLICSGMDLALFTVLCVLLRGVLPIYYVAASTILARLASGSLNFFLNYRVVFKSSKSVAGSAGRYVALAIAQMLASAALSTLGVVLLPMVPEVAVKAIVDTCLFFVSYRVQRALVF